VVIPLAMIVRGKFVQRSAMPFTQQGDLWDAVRGGRIVRAGALVDVRRSVTGYVGGNAVAGELRTSSSAACASQMSEEM
jgi:hypothetical protein